MSDDNVRPRGGLARLLAQGWIEKLAFVLAVSVVTFALGVATAEFKLPPYHMLKQGWQAVDARLSFATDRLPADVKDWVPAPTAGLTRTLSPEAGHEHVLIVGSFYSRMDLCPKFGCLAWVIDRQGKAVKSWPAPDPKTLFKDIKGFSGRVIPNNFYVFGLAYQADGSLIVTFHARDMFPYQVGIAKFDTNGAVLWKHFDFTHHWPKIGPDGLIYVPYAKVVDRPEYFGGTMTDVRCDQAKSYVEGIRVYDQNGAVVRDINVEEQLLKADYPGLVYSVRDGCDAYHINSLDFVNKAGAEKMRVTEGDLLVSLREISGLAVLSQTDGLVKALIPGRASAQHSPNFMPDGDIAVFDNLGGQRRFGGSRIIKINPRTRLVETVFPKGDEGSLLPFYSENAGVIALSADASRAMVASTRQGRVIEIDMTTGKPLWTYDNILDFAPYLKANKIKRKQTFALMPAYGAYYIDDGGVAVAASSKGPAQAPPR